jgi:G:T-mismatch repair DNA endonuclease (very short patch repair protein)
MADVHSKEIRSKNMAAIKGKNTKWWAEYKTAENKIEERE